MQNTSSSSLDAARADLLARRVSIGPVFVEPVSVAHLWIFEALAHPFTVGRKFIPGPDGKPEPLRDAAGQPVTDEATGAPLYMVEPLSMRDLARAIYCFHDSAVAVKKIVLGVEAYDAAALDFVRALDPVLLPKIYSAITAAEREAVTGFRSAA